MHSGAVIDIDIDAVATLVANMIAEQLKVVSQETSSTEAKHDFQNTGPSHKPARLRLRPPVNNESSSLPSGEHRATIRPEGQSHRSGLGRVDGPGSRCGSRSLRSSNDGQRRFQDTGCRRLNGQGWSGIGLGGITTGPFLHRLASSSGIMLINQYSNHRRGWLLRPSRFQRSTSVGVERGYVSSRTPLHPRPPPGRQIEQSKKGAIEISSASRFVL